MIFGRHLLRCVQVHCRLKTKFCTILTKYNFLQTMTNTPARMPMFGVFFVLGGPGAGKGTLCSRIAGNYNIIHLSAGELLRNEMNGPDSPFAAEILSCMKTGAIVPVAITCSLLYQAMVVGYNNQRCINYLVDGFPRNEDNNAGWIAAMNDKTNLLRVFVVDCPEEVCIERCLGRNSHRIDDNEDTLRRRLLQFKSENLPIIEYYTKKGLVSHINGIETPEQNFQQTKSVIDTLIHPEQQH